MKPLTEEIKTYFYLKHVHVYIYLFIWKEAKQ